MEEILEILKYTLPAFIVGGTAYLLVSRKLDEDRELQKIKLHAEHGKEMLPLRLQAYERLALFLERIDFVNLLPRTNSAEYTVKDFQQALIITVKSEFEHNLSQQIYVSGEVWVATKIAKDETIKLINLVSASLDPAAPSKELYTKLLEIVLSNEGGNAARRSLGVLNTEVKNLF